MQASLQHELLAAQVSGARPDDTTLLQTALGVLPPLPPRLRTRLVGGPSPSSTAVLATLARASAQPCFLGSLLEQLLAGGLLHSGEVLAAVPAAELAAAVAGLHASGAHRAFAALLKLLVTSSGERAAEQALGHLRQSWVLPAPDRWGSPAAATAAALLLEAAIEVVAWEVFPRTRATRQARAALSLSPVPC